MIGVGLGRPPVDDVRDDGLLRRRELALVLGQEVLERVARELAHDLDEDVVARNTLAETNIARSTSRASNDSNRISIASQEDFKF